MQPQISLGTLASATSSAGVKPEDTNARYARGATALAILQPTNGAFVGTAKIQGTNDLDSVADGSASWTDLLTFVAPAANSGSKQATVTLMRRMRVNCGPYTSGSIDGVLIAD